MIKELHEKLLAGKITSEKLTQNYFSKIKKKDEKISAFLTLTEDLAMAQAKKTDEKIKKGEEIGILEGIPGAVKDVICMKGVRTTAASKILDNYIAPYDATVIQKLKASGAVFLGKTNCDEFAMGSSTEKSAYAITKNPADLQRVPGGSSGGSAAAVAGDEAVWALGSDTGGSIRQPASFCGVVGLKPTYGRVSRYGLLSMASSFDQIGPIAKNIEDAAIILSEIAGQDKRDATSARSAGKRYEKYLEGSIQGLKIGFIKEHFENLNKKVKNSMENVLKKYARLGAEIKEINLPHIRYSLPVYYIVMPCEVSSNLARFDGMKYGMRIFDQQDSDLEKINPEERKLREIYLDSRRYGLGEEVKKRIMLGTYALSSGYYEAYYLRAQKVRELIKRDFEKIFASSQKGVDLILAPTTPTPAFKIGEKNANPIEMYLEDIFTVTANVIGIPAISLPADPVDWEGKKLPVGFQLMGKWFNEEGILRAAYAYEKSS
ncbi:MAG: Asp-tRNA(Asn)/Glu-tRNA(Gln) amidotransferase GatCAB subunit A [Candidatus Moranbacteria bacterium CG_4_9_14_3_um_filter_40_7]|nr:MAG: Asp-tRNA(Asn)/Glu-tRNA(Gln) amidotransferase GatCAB subunit A [Candidatus Moranbacteria bacterium CG23_combo_of_CG06-09_8_20_14_all_40_16]PIU80366.1 MAG: Asp-tRNA(Asn)/Glu-tRNA(Gln) amidotransferase GatCAB subunit A [Candidatus Moranbacteria bacterium CG06_land_8_20_14_3_00_40_12]PJA87467.1 MAG: Asp-tRNA(Asn)/Glu-tRNA(Gln) amidotransferase GatCAB subunit A [Candidatus Moranbacteria bacterium CG_4_9_14_3_um_filter_40_7]